MEKFPTNSNQEANNPEKSGKLSKIIKAAVLAGSVALGSAPDVEAQVVKKETAVQKEAVKEMANTIWAKEMADKAIGEKTQLKNGEDLRMWTQSHIMPFISEFYMPTKGNLVDGTYGKSRRLSPDEARVLIKHVSLLENAYLELHKKFNQPTGENITGQFKGMKDSLTEDTSYARQKEREILENWERKQK
ncbi:MAG: hypothetical protein AAB513_00055 [Patescibacteria group bacterium]